MLSCRAVRPVKGRLVEWNDHKVCTMREMESLIGSFNYVCEVVKLGCSFLCWMLTQFQPGHSPMSMPPRVLEPCIRLDLQWWRNFIVDWSGVSIWKDREQPVIEVMFSAWSGKEWLQVQWVDVVADMPITVK